ncbi:ribosomal protection-like ABC-F family protein [Indiicoccus explosivorum]|uniref:ribosomal protection-like ABC-F family protein n=1 Tax=Indiicoccus explosivorum TaxID=1917864 RepID=UPI000B43B36C|nr:ABC-F family ATP-binding cassette domain-containing protein [Indiicoccus explosivorum]
MTIIGRLHGLTIQFDGRTIIEKAEAEIYRNARIAIIGPNGAGKSSLLEAIAAGDLGVVWTGAAPEVRLMRQETRQLPDESGDLESRKLRAQWHVPAAGGRLSGGEAMKLRLSEVLSETAGLLLLDEPTNHLDGTSLDLLKEKIRSYRGTVMYVSHDRHFIDDTATHVWELENRQLIVYEGNYTDSRREREHMRLTQQRKYERQQAKISRIEKQISELRSWSDKAHAESTKQDGFKEHYRKKAKRMDVQIKSKKKRLETELAKERTDAPAEEIALDFDLLSGRKKGSRVLELKRAGKDAGGRALFRDASFTVLAGERIGLFGPNGSGKTTLFEMILGRTDFSGQVWKTEGMSVGYLSQDIFDLPEEQTPSGLYGTSDFKTTGTVRTLMDHLGFEQTHWQQQIGEMSMGERVKLKLMEFMLAECDVLLLDEPTNHLDLPSREQLETALSTFPGTLLVATHDRYFMERLADKLLIFENGRLFKFDGSLADWRNRKEPEQLPDILMLETERQAVLGKLSALPAGHADYRKLDEQFNELTARIQELKQQQNR